METFAVAAEDAADTDKQDAHGKVKSPLNALIVAPGIPPPTKPMQIFSGNGVGQFTEVRKSTLTAGDWDVTSFGEIVHFPDTGLWGWSLSLSIESSASGVDWTIRALVADIDIDAGQLEGVTASSQPNSITLVGRARVVSLSGIGAEFKLVPQHDSGTDKTITVLRANYKWRRVRS